MGNIAFIRVFNWSTATAICRMHSQTLWHEHFSVSNSAQKKHVFQPWSANSNIDESNKCNRPFTDVYLTLMYMSGAHDEKKDLLTFVSVDKANENPLIISMQISKKTLSAHALSLARLQSFYTFGKWLFHVRPSIVDHNRQSSISLQIAFFLLLSLSLCRSLSSHLFVFLCWFSNVNGCWQWFAPYFW